MIRKLFFSLRFNNKDLYIIKIYLIIDFISKFNFSIQLVYLFSKLELTKSFYILETTNIRKKLLITKYPNFSPEKRIQVGFPLDINNASQIGSNITHLGINCEKINVTIFSTLVFHSTPKADGKE